MDSKARQAIQYRRSLWAGLSISVAVHAAAAVTMVSMPGTGPADDDGRSVQTVVPDEFEAIELVTLPSTSPVDPTSIRPTTADAASGAHPTPSVEATSRPSLEEMLADLAPASVAAMVPETGRPVVTFRDLEPVAQTEAMLAAFAYGGGLQDGKEDEGGGWSAFLGGISAALSGGGHCPTPGGPLILR